MCVRVFVSHCSHCFCSANGESHSHGDYDREEGNFGELSMVSKLNLILAKIPVAEGTMLLWVYCVGGIGFWNPTSGKPDIVSVRSTTVSEHLMGTPRQPFKEMSKLVDFLSEITLKGASLQCQLAKLRGDRSSLQNHGGPPCSQYSQITKSWKS